MARAKRATEEPVEIEVGSGNVFEDLGLRAAGDRLAKAELTRVIHCQYLAVIYDDHRERASADRRRAAARMPMPTRFITPMSSTILNAKVNTLSTLMIGNTDSTM